ncbi:Uncharacterized protein TPAR_01613, partial [Tolypocladium paradoxum]
MAHRPGTPLRKINLVRIAHVYYSHKNIDKARQFLLDFGFQEVERHGSKTYYRGTGSAPFVYCASGDNEDKFGGSAFVVESAEDLDYASKTLPNATPVHEVLDEPGGGFRVTFTDPVDGFPFHLVHGQKLLERGDADVSQRTFNFVSRSSFGRSHQGVSLFSAHTRLISTQPEAKLRSGNQFQRFEKGEPRVFRWPLRADVVSGPAPVHKLGHFGMCVTDFAKTYSFYTSRFNFAPSDLVYDENNRDVTTFLHLDRGSELVDHHCFFFFEGPKCHVHHSSFETFDFDTQLLGHDHLRERGYENCWGVGRHIMGSQIFDYWYDPSRFILEHYVDGDLVDATYQPNRTKVGPGNLHVW